MAGYDDDEWVGGVPPEGRHTRDQARPEFWWHQRPARIAFAGILVALVILVVVALAGCGGSSGKGGDDGGRGGGGYGGKVSADRASQPPAQIIKDAQAALQGVHSYHVSGTTVDKDGHNRISGDVTDSGSLRFSLTNKGTTLAVVVAGGQTYLKAGRRFWLQGSGAQGPALARLFADRWVKMPAREATSLQSDVKQLLPKELAFCLAQNLGTLQSVGARTVAGRRVVVVRDKGDRPGTAPGELSVPQTGPALPVRTRQTGPRKAGGKIDKRCSDGSAATRTADATLSRFDAIKAITPPPNALDLEQLKGAAGTPA
ncbi:MAG: hypothetical protein JWN65_2799 [Solirubrobacterales bacterium]|nr:hypothetical protein [Solirubrobacterales bacterium]